MKIEIENFIISIKPQSMFHFVNDNFAIGIVDL